LRLPGFFVTVANGKDCVGDINSENLVKFKASNKMLTVASGGGGSKGNQVKGSTGGSKGKPTPSARRLLRGEEV
jgi:hypothetical protein